LVTHLLPNRREYARSKANVWNVDTGAAFKGPLTIMDVDTKEFWQSEPLTVVFDEKEGIELFCTIEIYEIATIGCKHLD
jgi:hypothetical protein